MLNTKCNDCIFFKNEDNFCHLNVDKYVKKFHKNSQISKGENETIITNFTCKYQIGEWYEKELPIEERAKKRLKEKESKIIAVIIMNDGEIDLELYKKFDLVYFVNPLSLAKNFKNLKSQINNEPKYHIVQMLSNMSILECWSEGAEKAYKEAEKNNWISYIGFLNNNEKISADLPHKIRDLADNKSRSMAFVKNKDVEFFIHGFLLKEINYGYQVEYEETKELLSNPVSKIEKVINREGATWAMMNY